MIKFSLGPWHVSETSQSNIGLYAIVDFEGFTVCNPSPIGIDDANLISAAPDLFHALTLMLREHDALCIANNDTEDRWLAAGVARKALAKALGE